MQFSVSRDNIYKALQKVIHVVPGKSTIEILYNVLLTTEEGKLKIMATDLEITQIAWCNAQIEEEGSIAVPGRLFADILREMPETDLVFKSDPNHKVIIESSFGEYKLSGQNKNDYPSIPAIDSEDIIAIENTVLKRMIEKTIFACSADNLRPALTGVFFQIYPDHLIMVATDGHRLVKIQNNKFSANDLTRELIIPTRALNFVARNIGEDGSQNIVIGAAHVLFKFEDTHIYSRIINEPYPDYQRVIPEANSKEMFIDRESLISSVKRVSLFSNPISSQVRINLSENKLTVYAQDIDFGGEAHESLDCVFNSGEMVIAYNANYLQDILKHIDSDKVKVMLETADGPALAYPEVQEENEELVMLIMPVRLSN